MGAQVIPLRSRDETATWAELARIEERWSEVRGLYHDAARERQALEHRIVRGDLVAESGPRKGQPLKAAHRILFLGRLREATRTWHDLVNEWNELEGRAKALRARLSG
jgi:hypothetical protein